MPNIMNRKRIIGILWVIAGVILLGAAFREEPRDIAPLVLGVVAVAVGAALVRRARHS
jgi:uncharacterized membrane protein HdeD (DUF308 family)